MRVTSVNSFLTVGLNVFWKLFRKGYVAQPCCRRQVYLHRLHRKKFLRHLLREQGLLNDGRLEDCISLIHIMALSFGDNKGQRDLALSGMPFH